MNSPLRAFRAAENLTLDDLAERLGADKSTLSRWETGVVVIPAERAVEIERVTGIPRADLRPDLWSAA